MKNALLLGAVLSVVIGVAAWAGDTYDPSNTPTAGTCNVIPWSGPWPSSSNPNGEWRYQSYHTATTLGNKPFVITDVSYAPCGTGTLTCDDFEVRISHTQSAVSSTFATNLPNPVTVFFAKRHTYSYTNNQWSPIGLQCPFFYNGVDNLTVEIRYKNGTIAGHSGSFHRDTAPRIYAYGPGSYSVASGSTGNAALKIRLTFADLTLSTATPKIGTSVALYLDDSADPGKFYFCASSLGVGRIPLGCWTVNLALDPLFFISLQNLAPTVFNNYQGILDSAGLAKAVVNVPNMPALVGVKVASAYVVLGTTFVDAVSPTVLFQIN